MTLQSSLSTHNDAALEALSSKGLVRRARRDLQAGKASIEDASEDIAKIRADGQSVVLDSRGPTAATCTCPASGVCRHILLAVMVMQDNNVLASTDASLESSATDDLRELQAEELTKFAGADWKKAIGLVAQGVAIEFVEDGPSLTVRLIDLDSTVTFIAGHGLTGAAYKGPKSRKRLLVTVSALLLQQREGVLPADVEYSSVAPVAQVSTEFIDQSQKTLERAVAAILLGRSAIGYDRFLDLAISARTEALPRLSADLRALANQSLLAMNRDVAFEMDGFLKRAARAYALLEALRTSPRDPELAGTVRREYRQANPVDLWSLGVSRWRSNTGARGLSAYFFDPHEKTWLTVNEGRSAATDPGFDVSNAYRMPIWGVGTLQGLIGKRVHVPAPMIAVDGSISANASENASLLDDKMTINDLIDAGAATTDWLTLYDDLASRFGSGLRMRSVSIPALIAPSRFRGFGFNDLDQVYEWEAVDSNGRSVLLAIPGDQHETAAYLRQSGNKIKALLVSATLDSHGLILRPITAISWQKSTLNLLNLDFDSIPSRRAVAQSINALTDAFNVQKRPKADTADSVSKIVSAAFDGIVSVLSRSPSSNLDLVLEQCDAIGLLKLAETIRTLQQTGDVRSALKASYVASEVERSARLSA